MYRAWSQDTGHSHEVAMAHGIQPLGEHNLEVRRAPQFGHGLLRDAGRARTAVTCGVRTRDHKSSLMRAEAVKTCTARKVRS